MSELHKLTPASCRAARALLGWSQADLVREARVSPNTVAKVEAGDSTVTRATLDKLASVLAGHGVELLNGEAPGARLRKAAP
jgi:transcriptional regulator with XRE-family HTH domain